MGVLGLFSGSASKDVPAGSEVQLASPDLTPVSSPPDSSTAVPPEAEGGPSPVLPTPLSPVASDVPPGRQSEDSAKPPVPRRLSFRPFAPAAPKHKPILSEVQEHERKTSAANAFTKRFSKPLSSNSEKRAKESALIVRTLIVGPSSNDYTTPKATKAIATPQMSKVKSQLMQPNSANRVIAQLRILPVMDDEPDASHSPSVPIHAVCLAYPDAEEHELRFEKFTPDGRNDDSSKVPNVASTPLERLASTFAEMHIVSLITTPNFGLGDRGDGEGLLAGAVPTAETVINGIEQITPQLMALGYATGRAVLPDHKGVHPPTDRISVLTYWWGLELVLPPSTLVYLSNAHSISGTLINFLTALSLLNNGVREILPFVRYIAQFVDFEFSAIQKQDRGQGVVCAATWIMPAALVPRPWDFPPPDPVTAPSEEETGPADNSEQTNALPDSAASVPLPASPSPKTPLNGPSPKQSLSPIVPVAVPSRMSPPVVMHNSQTVMTPRISLS
ncbi:hypothetical protein DFH07DRAFT_853409 [Mycena maculata]|uniref:Uncharacterized protein n=1 Tax=Mycena maculata TaxID=230809 RepID=A0AAD7HRK7_9AGAR|nr:hypothetical protein DFH07DRAFT_853409 [Mycena maculata]